jgi:plasmid maintenance system antidote protein VapI
MSVHALAKRLRVPDPGIDDIVLEKRGITANTAVQWRFLEPPNSSG